MDIKVLLKHIKTLVKDKLSITTQLMRELTYEPNTSNKCSNQVTIYQQKHWKNWLRKNTQMQWEDMKKNKNKKDSKRKKIQKMKKFLKENERK